MFPSNNRTVKGRYEKEPANKLDIFRNPLYRSEKLVLQ